MQKLIPIILALSLTACFNDDASFPLREPDTGGSGGATGPGTGTPDPGDPAPPTSSIPAFPGNLQLSIDIDSDSRELTASWTTDDAIPEAYHFTLCAQELNAVNNCRPLLSGPGNQGGLKFRLGSEADDLGLDTLLLGEPFVLFSGPEGEFGDKEQLRLSEDQVNSTVQYIKASSPASADEFGRSLALSGDGKILAVGSATTSRASANGPNVGISLATGSGGVYIFSDTDAGWKQTAFLKFSHPNPDDNFGAKLAINDDGTVLAVGMPGDSSNGTGTTASPANNLQFESGAVVIFNRIASNWTQSAFLKASRSLRSLHFGGADVELSADGNMLAASSSNGSQVETFVRNNGRWSSFATVTGTGVESSDKFGQTLALSQNGGLLAVSAPENDSNTSSTPANNSLSNSGSVYIFSKGATSFSQSDVIKPTSVTINSQFGRDLALSATGDLLVVSTANRGVYVLAQRSSNWDELYTISAPSGLSDFGISLDLSQDGSSLAVSSTTAPQMPGINGVITNSSPKRYGAVTLYGLTQTSETLKYQLQQKFADVGDHFGRYLSFNKDGKVLAVSAYGEDSSSGGINSKVNNNFASSAGAVWVYYF